MTGNSIDFHITRGMVRDTPELGRWGIGQHLKITQLKKISFCSVKPSVLGFCVFVSRWLPHLHLSLSLSLFFRWLTSLLLWRWVAGVQELLVEQATSSLPSQASDCTGRLSLCEWQACADLGGTCSCRSCAWCCWGWPGHSGSIRRRWSVIAGGMWASCYHYTFPLSPILHAHSLVVNQPR